MAVALVAVAAAVAGAQGLSLSAAAHGLLQQARHLQDARRSELPGTPARSEPAAAETRAILTAAARRHGLRPSFVLAVSYWESGWNQSLVSSTGAVGLMQVSPATAEWAGPALLHRRVNLRDPRDNADIGAALLRSYLDQFDDPKLALAAYYQGAAATRRDGIYPGSRTYVDGIWALRNQFESGEFAPRG